MVEVVLPHAAKEALKGTPLSREVQDICHRMFIQRTENIIVQYNGPRKYEGYWRKSTRQVSLEQVSRGALKLHQRYHNEYFGD